MLLTAKPHVLMILDCCFAANAARDTTEGSSKELLAACGRENKTLGVGMRSFTSVLIEELQSFEGAAFTVAMLHARLITLRHKLAYTPIYAALAEKGGNSIVISPLPRTPSPSPQGPERPTGQLECMYKSHSTLLLVSVPTVGWSRLRESAAYRFIGFIKSGNLICEDANPDPIREMVLQPI